MIPVNSTADQKGGSDMAWLVAAAIGLAILLFA